MAGVKLKRVYEKPSNRDGYRILVDRIWPRGIKKEEAKLSEWNKEIAPSTELRKWYGHKPDRFAEFSKRYRQELKTKTDELKQLKKLAQTGTVTLVFAAKEPELSNAAVLRDILTRR